ncbi:MAG: hypothetical protein IJJ50_03350 [Lachnospiraceae bacterium]|nr:hypothetical protein [Lachnospiraceae bacterium]
MNFLGIDVGSTFLKCSVLNLTEGTAAEASGTPTPAFAKTDLSGAKLSPACREIPMEQLASAVRTLIEKAEEAYGIDGVVFSVQMHGFMLFDPQGMPLTNYISWQDTRGVMPGAGGISVLEELRGEEWKSYFEEDGVRLRPNHSVVPLTCYAREHKIAPGTQFAMIGDALVRMLAGKRVPVHPTNAASSGLYSLSRGEWNKELLEKLGLGHLDMPPVEDSRRASACYIASDGREIPLYAALGDQQATVLGIGTGIGDVFINIGTGGQIGYCAAEPVPGPYETRPYFGGSFIRTVTQLPSGRTINVLMQFLKSIGKEIFVPLVPGLAGPGPAGREVSDDADLEAAVWDYIDHLDFEDIGEEPLRMDFSFFGPDGGSVAGITGSNFTIANLIRSTYLAFARSYAENAAVLNIPETAEGKGEVVCTGGVVRKNKPLFRCIESVFPRKCRIAECTDDSMEGLLQFAKWCADGEKTQG